MTTFVARPSLDRQEAHRSESAPPPAGRRTEEPEPCGGAPVLDLALCLILAVAIADLLILAL